jgi:hypothetical protein
VCFSNLKFDIDEENKKYYFHNKIIVNIEVKYELVKKERHRIITLYSLREL